MKMINKNNNNLSKKRKNVDTVKRKTKRQKKNVQKKPNLAQNISEDATLQSENSNKEESLVKKSEILVPSKKVKWTNKQRVLVFSSRGITYRNRHLMEDLRGQLPHSRAENKKDKKEDILIINEMAAIRNCNKCIYFENRKKQDLYLWMSNVPQGPCAKFLVENIHTKDELKLTGNSLKGSRPLLTFDKHFDNDPHYALLKELMTQIFGSPLGHPKTQPFFDKVFVFSVFDAKIWFRNYQIVEEDGQLTEIGPRFVLNPIKIFDGSFGGVTLWSNSEYKTPNSLRRMKKEMDSVKYKSSVDQQLSRSARGIKTSLKSDPTQDYFGVELPKALEKKKNKIYNRKNK